MQVQVQIQVMAVVQVLVHTVQLSIEGKTRELVLEGKIEGIFSRK